MRILLVSDWMSYAGGSEVYIVGLKQWLTDAGDDVRLLTCGVESPPHADARVFGTDNVIAQAALQVVNPFAIAGVRRIVRQFRPDAALVSHFAFHLSPAVLSALESVPTVVSLMDYKAVCPLGSKLLPEATICHHRAGLVCWQRSCVSFPHWLRDRPRYALIRSALANAGGIVCPSAWMQEEFRRNGIESEWVPLPVATSAKEFKRVPAPDPTFVVVGRLSREKGIDVLLRAFRRVIAGHPTARLRVVGDGPLQRETRQLADSLGLTRQTEFAGQLSPADVEAALTDAWALVAPSTWAEPFGLAVVEAIVRGVPAVATALGGFADNVEEGVSGLLVPNGDEERLAIALDDVASGRAFPGHVVSAAAVARLAQRLSPHRHVERLHAAFRTAAATTAS